MRLTNLDFPWSTPIDKGSAEYFRLNYTFKDGRSFITFSTLKDLVLTVKTLDLSYQDSLCGSGGNACYLSDICNEVTSQLEEDCRNHSSYKS
jgi:hypothetical protein